MYHQKGWGNTIIDGHNRWKIIQKHPELKWTVKQMDFQDKWAAIVWMCRNQLGRRNLTEEQTAYIIKQEYEAQQKTSGGTGANQYTKKEQLDPLGQAVKTDTRSSVARAHGVSEHFVQNSVAFGRGLDAAEEVLPGIKNAVLSDSQKAICALFSFWRPL